MRVSSEVWAALNQRLEELLTVLSSCSAEPESLQALSALQGLALILHLAALCSSTLRYLPSNRPRSTGEESWQKEIQSQFFCFFLSTVPVLWSGFLLRLWAGC